MDVIDKWNSVKENTAMFSAQEDAGDNLAYELRAARQRIAELESNPVPPPCERQMTQEDMRLLLTCCHTISIKPPHKIDENGNSVGVYIEAKQNVPYRYGSTTQFDIHEVRATGRTFEEALSRASSRLISAAKEAGE